MTCKEFIDFLDDYSKGNQPAPVRAEFERHLSACPSCVDYLKTYTSSIQLAQAAAEPNLLSTVPKDAPEELIQAILAARRQLEQSQE